MDSCATSPDFLDNPAPAAAAPLTAELLADATAALEAAAAAPSSAPVAAPRLAAPATTAATTTAATAIAKGLPIPRGLQEALRGLAREALRHQPADVVEFARWCVGK